MALGTEYRQEKLVSTPSDTYLSGDFINLVANGTGVAWLDLGALSGAAGATQATAWAAWAAATGDAPCSASRIAVAKASTVQHPR